MNKLIKKPLLYVIGLVLAVTGFAGTTKLASASQLDEQPLFISSTITDFEITESDGLHNLSGSINEFQFSVNVTFYNLFDHVDNNKIYAVETGRDIDGQVVILNIEFEKETEIQNSVLRVAAYIDNQFYYAEQVYEIESIIFDNVVYLSIYNENNFILQKIFSNSSWFMNIEPQELVNTDQFMGITPNVWMGDLPYWDVPEGSSAAPYLGASLDVTDIDLINTLGKNTFNAVKDTQVRWFTSNGILNGGCIVRSKRNPILVGPERIEIVTECLYFSLVLNIPKENNKSELQMRLVADRTYKWREDTNKIESWSKWTNYRIYDAKLAMECAQKDVGKGYDYISSREISLNYALVKQSNIGFTIAKQLDPFNILSWGDVFFEIVDLISDHKDNGMYKCIWPTDYNAHLNDWDNFKRKGTMVRGVRIDTKDHLLTKENDSLVLTSTVEDRDYANNASNIAMTKAMKYAISFNLRTADEYSGFLAGKGNDCGNVTKEVSLAYTR